MASPKVWFITGASSGLGRAMTEHVLSNGDIAVATLRTPSTLSELSAQHPASRLLVLPLDVTQPDAVAGAFAQARAAFGRVDVVFNNAGYVLVSEVESAAEREADARALFEVNFWGALRVSQAAVAFFREVNQPCGGWLLQVSSTAALGVTPAGGFYSATKAALESVSEALAKELDPAWNVKVTIIEPGGIATSARSNQASIPQHPAYSQTFASAARARFANSQPTGDAAKAVEAMYKLASLPDPPLYFMLSKDPADNLKKKVEGRLADVEKYAAWSEDVFPTSS
ncbi:NAD-P-binding protein [Obba rivulosa]|uniref:NAD-P-binding protein n=1 Tax=Obba rivulosa TaxID=1052685 RepID=A0A8E2ATT2_9APHY|nr:NAD-P-binding protein [Obba rivulosa]